MFAQPENNRVDILHCLIHEHGLSKKLHNADLGRRDHRLQILDVGCGTGIWPLEMAKESPDADVVGIDLITNQATREGLRNVRFQTPIDFTSPDWGLTERAFDFVRMSQLCGSVPSWSQLYYTVSKYLRPGDGYVEHIELDWRPRCLDPNGYPPQAKPLFDWYDSLHYASGLAERSIAYREDTEALLTGAGFTDINHKIIRIPLHNLSTDAREHDLAQYYLTAMCIPDDNGNPNQSFEGLTMSLSTRQLRWAPHQVKSLCDAVRDVCKSNYQNLYHNVHVWTARKPGQFRLPCLSISDTFLTRFTAPQRSSTNSRARVG